MQQVTSPLPKRPRVRGFNYSTAGFYFVTVVANDRECMFGEVVDYCMKLSELGELVEEHLLKIPLRFPHILVDTHVVMPNHVHALLRFDDSLENVTLSRVVNEVKGMSTVRYNKLAGRSGSLWQYGFYDVIIRSERQLFSVRQYIVDNPAKWALDDLNPANSVGCSE